MQYNKDKVFPYPVLRPESDDFSDCEFQCGAALEIINSDLILEIQYDLSSESITELVESGRAEVVFVLSCRQTYFSKSYSFGKFEHNKRITLDQTKFIGEVIVNKYIRINEDLSFTSSEINSEFGQGPFTYQKNDIIAQEEPTIYFLDKEFFRPIHSLIDIAIKDNIDYGCWEIDLSEDHIIINVNKLFKEKIDIARQSNKNKIILLNSLYLSAFSSVIYEWQKEECNTEQKWAKVLASRIESEHLDPHSNPIELANKLFMIPLKTLANVIFKDEGGKCI